MTMNMEQRLYDIITKHGLDTNFPNYRKKHKAEELLRKWIAEWTNEGKRVLVLLSSKMDMRALENFSWKNDKIVYRLVENEEDWNNLPEEPYDLLVVGSLHNTYHMENALYRADRDFVSIYEKFREEGLLFDIEWYETGGGVL